MLQVPRVYIGHDTRQPRAYAVAADSVLRHASGPVSITPIHLERNERRGVLTRPWVIKRNRMFDVASEASCSTEFAISRFLTPLLAQEGPALFIDSDVVFLSDVYELFALAKPEYAVHVVKHSDITVLGEVTKMDGQAQESYARKNWSSLMLFNASHRGHDRLTLDLLNQAPGRDLHAFCWLWDNEIGALPAEWNWLVGMQPKPKTPRAAHFTLGGPWINDWKAAPHDELWLDAEAHLRTRSGAGDADRGESPGASRR
jgi:lipopolysaccharide biosynthesis glycosyltransferase